MKKKKIVITFIIIACVCSAGYYFYYIKKKPANKTARVKTYKISPQSLTVTTNAKGMSYPGRTLMVSSPNGGLIEKIYFNTGAYVKKGTPLLKIDSKLNLLRLNNMLDKFDETKELYEKNKNDSLKRKLDSYEKKIEVLRKRIKNAKIKSPISGYIAKIFVQENEIVEENKRICTIIQKNTLKIRFSVPADEVKYLKKDETEIKIIFDDFPSDILKTKINYIARQPDKKNSTYRIESKIENTDNKYRPWLTAKVIIKKHNIVDGIIIPEKSIIDYYGISKVFVCLEDNSVELRTVEKNLSYDDKTEIISGLNFGENIIVEGMEKLKNGKKVKIIGQM